MPDRDAATTPRGSVARVVGILAVLLGILLLQGSLCDGTATAVPCVGSCDQAETVTADVDHVTALTFDLPAPADEPDDLVSLCVTVLLAVLLAAALLRRPSTALTVPSPPRAPARTAAAPRALSLPQLCALRL